MYLLSLSILLAQPPNVQINERTCDLIMLNTVIDSKTKEVRFKQIVCWSYRYTKDENNQKALLIIDQGYKVLGNNENSQALIMSREEDKYVAYWCNYGSVWRVTSSQYIDVTTESDIEADFRQDVGDGKSKYGIMGSFVSFW